MVKSDYIWLQWVTYGYVTLHMVTVGYIWLWLVTYGYGELHMVAVGYVIVVTWAREICLICMPEARGHTYQANHERPCYKYYASLPAL